MRGIWRSLVVVILGMGWIVSAASAVHLRVDSEGRLLGATGVRVGTETYSVDFVDGTCTYVFGGCTREAYFFEPLRGDLAAVALLEQVLVKQYDARPFLTRGCDGPDRDGFAVCEILFPSGFGEFERQCGDCGIFDIPFVNKVFNTPALEDQIASNEWYYDPDSDGWRMPNGGEHLLSTAEGPDASAQTWARFFKPVEAPSSLLLLLATAIAASRARFSTPRSR